jgi:NAD(P)-dependent dehydrogenase (short-subunit alcohol dehydrogenase family)
MPSIPCSPETGVIVTGGASGIGLASAQALAEAGRPVALWDLDGGAAERGAREIAARFGVKAAGARVDVRQSAAFPAQIRSAREALGSIGGVVHAAGVVQSVPIEALEPASWSAVIDVNLSAIALLTTALLPELRRHPGSSIVAIASINGLVGHESIPAYCASKAGVMGLVRSLADRLAPEGIRANSICPGYIDTPMLAPISSMPEGRKLFLRKTPMGRLGQPLEIGRAVRFLMSDDASFITATELVVDGGRIGGDR